MRPTRWLRPAAAVLVALLPHALAAQQYLKCESTLKLPPPPPQGQTYPTSIPLYQPPSPPFDWDWYIDQKCGANATPECRVSRSIEGVIGRVPDSDQVYAVLTPLSGSFWLNLRNWLSSTGAAEMNATSTRIAQAVYGRAPTLAERTAWTSRILDGHGYYLAIVDSLRQRLTGPVAPPPNTRGIQPSSGQIRFVRMMGQDRGAVINRAFDEVYGRAPSAAELAAVPTCNGFVQVRDVQHAALYASGNTQEVVATLRRAWMHNHGGAAPPAGALDPFVPVAVGQHLTYAAMLPIVK